MFDKNSKRICNCNFGFRLTTREKDANSARPISNSRYLTCMTYSMTPCQTYPHSNMLCNKFDPDQYTMQSRMHRQNPFLLTIGSNTSYPVFIMFLPIMNTSLKC